MAKKRIKSGEEWVKENPGFDVTGESTAPGFMKKMQEEEMKEKREKAKHARYRSGNIILPKGFLPVKFEDKEKANAVRKRKNLAPIPWKSFETVYDNEPGALEMRTETSQQKQRKGGLEKLFDKMRGRK